MYISQPSAPEPDLMASHTAPIVLPLNMKGWLAGPQRQFIEDTYLRDFQRLRRDDPGGAKELSKTAANKLIGTYGWRRPFNVPPELVEDEGPLSLEDTWMKAAVVACTATVC